MSEGNSTKQKAAGVDDEQKWSATYSSRVSVDLGAHSHTGHVRSRNEDCYFVGTVERKLQTLLTNLSAGELPALQRESGFAMLVADGMGGEASGDVASRVVVETLFKLVLETPDWHMRLDREGANEVFARFDERFRTIQNTLTEMARTDPDLTGMGSTLTLAISLGADLAIVHVGDTRAYLFHNDHLLQLTRDQSLAQDLADRGVISLAEMKVHYSRHLLTGVLSANGSDTQPELCKVTLTDGDQLLICSDGLTDMVSDDEIASVLKQSSSSPEACRVLVDMALASGGSDNVTVVLGRYRIPAN